MLDTSGIIPYVRLNESGSHRATHKPNGEQR